MSHSVTVTRTVTTSNTTSTLVLNTGYIKTLPGLLKLAQLVINLIIILVSKYYNVFQTCRLLVPFVLESLDTTTTKTIYMDHLIFSFC